ncbi:MAG TPA: glycosyltransferase family 4 protein [Candidatus Saccharimonadales bacterium]|nr:glycosyltransferase family 4 protein [Candidatus Saccharimonadales bacterium]
MNIAMMVRGYIPVPRPADMIYAPIDLASAIAEGLSRRGHNVDFYAPLGSRVPRARVESCNLRPLVKSSSEFRELIADPEKLIHYVPGLWDEYMARCMFERAKQGEYDILHFHHPESALSLSQNYPKIPVAYTIHDPISPWLKEVFDIYKSSNQHCISISNNQRRDGPDLPYVTTVHNGVDVKKYDFSSRTEDYLLFVGRVVPEKGVKEAIAVARETRQRLLIIGPTYADSQGYFDQYIKPQLDDQILYLGYVEQDKISPYYQKAKALLTPVQWEEPFGLTTIEAMASGTPVISFNRGAAPEIIENGKTGYVVDSTAEMIDAVNKIKNIRRIACRRHVEDHFSISKMVDGYEAAFEKIINERKTSFIVRRGLKQVPKAIRETSAQRRLQKIIKKSPIAKTAKPKKQK